MSAGTQEKTKIVEFSLNSPESVTVFVAGTFNNWSPSRDPMSCTNGKWKKRKRLAQGKHEYKFIVDGEWIEDPKCKDSVSNHFGDKNSVIII